MLSNIENCKEIVFHPFAPSYMKLSSFDGVQNGVLIKSSEYIKYNVLDELSKYRCEDFSLGNLIAIGAIDKLQPQVMSVSSDMNFVDNFERVFSSVTVPES